MILRERISANEKCEVLSILSSNLVLVISGLLGGWLVALLLSSLVIPLIQGVNGIRMQEVVVRLLVILGLMGAIAAKLLQWEYRINREAYKRVAEFHIPLVGHFFFLCILVVAIAQISGGRGLISHWLKIAPKIFTFNVKITVLVLTVGSAILSPALGAAWRFWNVLCLSIISPVNWRAVIEAQKFNRHLRMSFAEVKRYPSPLSLTIMDIDQSPQLKDRMVRKVQEELINIIDKNVREADVVGRIEGGKVVITMAHTGNSGAAIQAKRVKRILKEHLKSLEKKGIKLSLSVGIASYSTDMTGYADLMKRAQIALHRDREVEGDRLSVSGKDSLEK